MNRRYHRWLVRSNRTMKCIMRFCDRKGHNLRGMVNRYWMVDDGLYMINSPYMEEGGFSLTVDPVDGKTVDQIRSPDDIKKVVIGLVKQVPMVTSFSTLVYHATDVPPAAREVPGAIERSGDTFKDTYWKYLVSGLNNYVTEYITVE